MPNSIPVRRGTWFALVVLASISCGGAETLAPAQVSSIIISGVPVSTLFVGSTVQLIANPINSTGAVVSGQPVAWQSSDVSIATVNPSGLLLAVGAGTVTITATSGGASGSAKLDLKAGGEVTTAGGTLNMLNGAASLVIPANAFARTTAVLFWPTANTTPNDHLVPGALYQLGPDDLQFYSAATLRLRYDPTKLPAGVTEESLQLYTLVNSTWQLVAGSSVNTSTKLVSGTIFRAGIFAVIGTGVDHITVGGSAAGGALYAGRTGQLTASPFDANNNALKGRVITWASSDNAIATVDATGKVTGVAAGSATITATSEGKSASTTIAVLARPTADWSQATEWTMYQGDASHTGYVPVTADPSQFAEGWVTTVGTGLNPVAVNGSSVYVSAGTYFGAGAVSSLNASTGAVQWTQAVGNNNATMSPAYANGMVYVQTNDLSSYLWGFDATTGTTSFKVGYSSQWSRYLAPTVVGATIYMGCGSYDGLCAKSATDGTSIWFANTNQYDGWTPAVSGGVAYVYTGSYSPKLSAFNASTGATLFEIADPNFNWDGWTMGIAPTLGTNDLLTAQGGRLLSFDLVGHKIGYEIKDAFRGNVTVGNGVAYVINGVQLDARTESSGALAWRWVPPEGAPTGTTVLTKNLLFVSTSLNTYAIDIAAHRQVWSYPLGGQLALGAQGVLYIANASNGKLAAIRLK